MAKEKYADPVSKLRRKVVWMVHLIIIGSVGTFLMIEFIDYKVLKGGVGYNPSNALGMLLPMGLILGILTSRTLRVANGYVSSLVNGITRVAEGDFNVTLNLEEAGPLSDIFTDFNKMTRELQGVQSLRDDFVNQFSHEFKTPIMSIGGFASLMLEEELPREEQVRYLEIISSESRRLSDLSRNTLLLAKLESQQWIMNKSEYSLDEQLRECLILLESEWERKNIEITADLGEAKFIGNREIMSQLWINLLSNAVRYTPEDGRISLRLNETDQQLVVSVEDSGPGINPEEISRIFNKYYRGKDTGRGLGLGLSIVKRIIELCGGRIEVESETGKGSCFTVTLPRVVKRDSHEDSIKSGI